MKDTFEPVHRRRGRFAAQPASHLGKTIAQQMRSKGLTQQTLAARLSISHSTISRLLSGKTERVRISPYALADALELTGSMRARFLSECQRQRLHGVQPKLLPAPAQSQRPSARRKRADRATDSAIGRLLQPLLDEQDMSRRDLAEALDIQESTVSRIMSGAHATTYAISAEGISAALGLGGIARREFLKRAAELGTFALVRGVAAPSVLRHGSFDFTRFDHELRHADQLLQKGDARLAMERARALDNIIRAAPFLPTHKAAAIRRIETAMLVGRSQEAIYPWGERTLHAIQTYERIGTTILGRFAPSEMPLQYAVLYERQAPLYRELGNYSESIRYFTLAIEVFMRYIDDVGLLVALFRNRAHVWAVQGEEMPWQRDIHAAELAASRASPEQRRRLEGLILYSKAEGYKRLAGRVAPTDTGRQRQYARAALDHFDKARFVADYELAPHRLLAGVSEAQSLIWLDADEAIRWARIWRVSAERIYPSLVKKIDDTIANATRQRLGENTR